MPKIPTRENLFSQYSESLNSYDKNGVYTYVHKTSFGSYGFVGIDLTPNPGPGRPFNFFGIPRKVRSQVTIVDVFKFESYCGKHSILHFVTKTGFFFRSVPFRKENNFTFNYFILVRFSTLM